MARRRMPRHGTREGRAAAVTGQSLRQIIVDRFSALGPKQQAVARYLLDHQEFAAYASVYEVASASDVDVSTVVRLAKSFGFSGYPRLRQELRQDYLRHLRPPDRLTTAAIADHPETAAIRQEVSNLHLLAELLSPDQIAAAGQMLLKARRILIVGTGTHAIPGMALAHLGEAIGLPVDIETHTGPTLAPRLASLQPQDLLVAVGFWRVAREVAEAARWARSHGVPTLALTDSRFSPLALHADLVLTAPTESVSFFQSMVASLATIYAVLAWIMARDPERARQQLAAVQDINEKFLVHWKGAGGEDSHREDSA